MASANSLVSSAIKCKTALLCNSAGWRHFCMSVRKRSQRTFNWMELHHQFCHFRSFHISRSRASKVNLEVNERGLPTIRVAYDRKSLTIPTLWLRDHCHSSQNYNHETQQKIPDYGLLGRDVAVDQVDLIKNDSSIRISWKDGHVSEFTLDWLLSNFYSAQPKQENQKLLWTKDVLQSQPLPIVSFEDHMNSEAGLAQTLKNLCKYGFSLVEGADVSEAGTRSVVERITHVQPTLFGEMWTFSADGTRSDTAYSTQALGAHNDFTYMDSPAGIQVFHCLEHTGTGGETLLVDGFSALEELRQSHPADFDILTSTVIPHEYKEKPSAASPGYHLYSLGTVARVHPSTGELLQLRFNPYDRAPLNTVKPENIPQFYSAYYRLWNLISEPKREFWIKLKPGQVIFIDNWRVMHGRAQFDGKRVMCGCYMPRDDWISRALTHGHS